MPDLLDMLHQVATCFGAKPCLIDENFFKLTMTFKKEIEMPEPIEGQEVELDQEDG